MDSEKDRVIEIDLDLTETSLSKNETTNTGKTFWTTDSQTSYLSFKSTYDIANSTASLVLKNTSDGSVIQRTIEVKFLHFNYMLSEQEIERAGNWIGQIVVEKDGKALTSRSFKFTIKGSLLDSTEPALSDIENYQKFYQQLAELETEMSEFLEESRTTFSTISANENERKTNELSRVAAETVREETYETKVDTAIVESDVVTKVGDKVAELAPTIQQVTAQLAQKVGLGKKADLEDLSETVLSAIEGGTGSSFNLLSIPQNDSVSKAKLDAELKNEINSLFPINPNKNALDILNSTTTTIGWFNNAGDAVNVTSSESIENGLKKYKIDTTSAYTGGKKPYIAIAGKYPVKGNTEYLLSFDVPRLTAKAVFTVTLTDSVGNSTVKYVGILAGKNASSKFITPVNAITAEITYMGFDENLTGEHHLEITNLALKTTVLYESNLVDRVAEIETSMPIKKSYFVFDFDNPMLGWDDNRIKIVADEYGFPFKFVDYGTDPLITSSLLRKGCELSTYSNDSGTLPTDEQLVSDVTKTDAYVKKAILSQEINGFKNQTVWSNRQFKTGTALETSLNKYGYRIVRMRGGEFLPKVMQPFGQIKVRDTTTGWYQATLDVIDEAVSSEESMAIFTHLLVNTVAEDRGYDCTVAIFRQVLDKVKGYVDSGQAEVVTYKQYYDMFKA